MHEHRGICGWELWFHINFYFFLCIRPAMALIIKTFWQSDPFLLPHSLLVMTVTARSSHTDSSSITLHKNLERKLRFSFISTLELIRLSRRGIKSYKNLFVLVSFRGSFFRWKIAARRRVKHVKHEIIRVIIIIFCCSLKPILIMDGKVFVRFVNYIFALLCCFDSRWGELINCTTQYQNSQKMLLKHDKFLTRKKCFKN